MKTKLIKIGILSAIMLAVGLVGCQNGDETDPGPGPIPSNNTTVTSFTISEVSGSVTGSVGSSADSLDALQSPGVVQVPISQSQNVTINVTTASTYNTTVAYAVVSGGSGTPVFSSTKSGYNLVDGDAIYLKVTAEDKTTIRYYKIIVEIGRNAKLASVTIGTTPQSTEIYLGTPAAVWDDAEAGTFQTDPQWSGGLDIIIVTEDSAATIQYAVAQESVPSAGEPTWLAYPAGGVTTQPFDVTKEYYLYIKVTSSSTTVKLHYKMKLIIPAMGTIKYGKPKLIDPDDADNPFYVDQIWDEEGWDFIINRVNMAESASVQDYFRANPHTSAKAKAMWDDDGIWVYVDVDFTTYEDDEGATQNRPITTGGEYTSDSVEIFINERLQILETSTSKDLGNQFRVAPFVENNAMVTAGNRTGQAAPNSSLAPFTDPGYDKTRVKVKGNGAVADATNKGYEVLAHVPFKFKEDSDASNLFGTDKLVKEGTEIGLEIQLNTAVVNAQRDGILTWNGVNTRAYQNAAGYGKVALELGNRQRVKEAQAPSITVGNLADKVYITNTAATDVDALTVTATVTDGGDLSWQWYKATSATGTGVDISGANGTSGTGISYKPEIGGTEDTSWYYVVVTNTNNTADEGYKVKTSASARAKIETVASFAEKWVFNNPALDRAWSGTVNPDGSVTTTGTGTLIGYRFPVGDFTQVVIEGSVTKSGGTDPVKLISKNAYLANSPDCTTHNYPQLGNGEDGDFTFTFTYPIDTTASGNNPALHSGAITWQTNGNAVLENFRITRATFTTADSVDGSFYVNIADIDQRTGDGNFGDFATATFGAAADGTPQTILTYTNVGDSSNRYRAYVNLSSKTTNILGIAGSSEPAYLVLIGGEWDGTEVSVGAYLAESATSGQNWNVFNLSSGTITLISPAAYSIAVNNAAAGKKATGIVLRQNTAGAKLTLQYIKFVPIN